MIARIHEVDAVNAFPALRNDEGIALVRGNALFGIVKEHAPADRTGDLLPFARPCALESNEGIFAQKIELHARKAAYIQLLFCAVHKF